MSATDSSRSQLEEYRTSIDAIDAAMIYLLAERFRTTEKVGEYKKAHSLPAEDLGREEVQSEKLRRICESAGLDFNYAQSIFQLIMQIVKDRHRSIADG